jgi:hypothetical protein
MNGFDVNARDWLGRTIVHLTILYDVPVLTRFLFGSDFEGDPSHEYEVDPKAASLWLPPDFENIQTLARQDVDMNANDDGGNTPLHLAIKRFNIPAIKTLLADVRTDPNISDMYGIAPLHTAAAFSLEITRMLFSNLVLFRTLKISMAGQHFIMRTVLR